MEETHVPIEELLAHRDWLAVLCRRVVAGDADADDLAQETWVAALGRPPRRGGSVRGWLAVVARNLAFKRARGRARERRRGELVARPEGAPGGAAVAARVELEREVARRVLVLDEPYRTAVLLRYYEGLPASEIARREDVPAATIRSRVKRGLDRLRAGMESDLAGPDRPLAAVLLPILDPRAPLAGGTSLAGGVLVTMKSKLLAAALLFLLVAAGAWIAARPGSDVSAPPVPVAAASAEGAATPDEEARSTSADPSDVRSSDPIAGGGSGAGEPTAAPSSSGNDSPGTGVVSGIVYDPDDRLAVGAEVTLLDPHGPKPYGKPVRVGEDGRYRLEGARAGTVGVRAVRGESRARTFVVVKPDGEARGVLRLRRMRKLEGRVVDAAGGPVRGAIVFAFGGGYQAHGVTDAEGRFVLDAVPEGDVTVRATPASGPGVVRQVRVESAHAPDLELVLPAVASLDGRVRGPDGDPLVGWRIRASREPFFLGRGSAKSDAGGRFRIDGLSDAEYRLDVLDPETGAVVVSQPGVRPDPEPVEMWIREHELPSARIRARPIEGEGGIRPERARLLQVGRGQMISLSVADGVVESPPLPPGRWRLYVGNGRISWPAADFSLKAGEVRDLGELRVPASGRLLVRTEGAGPSGRERPPIHYRVRDLAAGTPGWPLAFGFLPKEGELRLTLSPGTYRVDFLGGVLPVARDVRVPEGGEAERRVGLEPAPLVRILPVGEDGGEVSLRTLEGGSAADETYQWRGIRSRSGKGWEARLAPGTYWIRGQGEDGRTTRWGRLRVPVVAKDGDVLRLVLPASD